MSMMVVAKRSEFHADFFRSKNRQIIIEVIMMVALTVEGCQPVMKA